jgi:glucokinase
MRAMSRVCLAVDVGGTKIAAALVDAGGSVLASARRPSDAARGGAAVLADMLACMDSLDRRDHELVAVGVSAAGVIDPRHGIVADATGVMPGWKGQQLGAACAARFGVPVACANDVHSALAGELWRNGALASVDGAVVMLTLGTGLGGAIAVDGRLLAGQHFLAGHFGRTRVNHNGRAVTLDSLVSGSGLSALYRELAGADADGHAVLTRAGAGEAAAVAALSAWLDHLAMALHNLYWMLDPALAIIGGGVIDGRAHWWAQLEARLAGLGAGPRLAAATLGSDAGVVGAARLAWQAAQERP